jgi:hypothetical protein
VSILSDLRCNLDPPSTSSAAVHQGGLRQHVQLHSQLRNGVPDGVSMGLPPANHVGPTGFAWMTQKGYPRGIAISKEIQEKSSSLVTSKAPTGKRGGRCCLNLASLRLLGESPGIRVEAPGILAISARSANHRPCPWPLQASSIHCRVPDFHQRTNNH